MAAKITRDALESYLYCKTKAHLKLAGHHGSISDYEGLLVAIRREVRQKVVGKILTRHPEQEVARNITLTSTALREGPSFVLDAVFEDDLHALVFDGLKKIGEPSALGDFHYVPMLFHEGRKVGKGQRLLLEAHGLLLSRIQGRSPAYGVVWHGRECKATRVRLSQDLRKAERILQEVREMAYKDTPPQLILNDHCQVCEFRQRCYDLAVKDDNLSLLRGMGEKEIRAYGQKGIFTVAQLSYTFRYRKPRKRAKHHAHPHYHSLQARSIRTGIVHIHGSPSLPTAGIRVYLDIEGIPERDFYYLIGVAVESGVSISHHQFWADDEAGQDAAFIQFIKLIGSMPNCLVYHFGNFETQALKEMQHRLPPQYRDALGGIITSTVNVLSIVHKHVYFPTYSNSLKEIAKSLGHQWTDADSHGLQSIVWREAWERDFDPTLKEKLVVYNKEDCLAVKTLCDYLSKVESGRPGIEASDGSALDVASTEDLPKPQRKWPTYGRPTFALKDLERASQCAYFDYQRERVYVRTERKFVRINRRARVKRKQLAPNKRVVIECEQCPACGSQLIKRKHRLRRRTIDIKFFKGGLKRWGVEHLSWTYGCEACGTSFKSGRWPEDRVQFQPGLVNWCVYQNIHCRQTMWQVQETLADIFNVRTDYRVLYRLRRWVAERYRSLYEEIRTEIVRGHLIHIDESTVSLTKNQSGYVWVLTSLDKVYFFYKPSREGSFLNEMLSGFTGVLVSDFFGAYESIDCPQQKCLLHLLRDVNDDLLRNPFDEELKEFAQDFAGLLRSIVDTADRHGLAKAYLSRHAARAREFVEKNSSAVFASEVMLRYQKRIKKFGDRLFTFLDHDGVPWNNNNAEHACKYFSKYRRLGDGAFTERSLQEALILLSIFQTCRFNGVNVMKFLLSGRADLASIMGDEGRVV